MNRLLLFDLDGTLLRPDKTISPVNLQALDDCRRAGCGIGIATARYEAAHRRTPAKYSRRCSSPAAAPWPRCRAKRSIKTGSPPVMCSGYLPVFATFAGQKRR